MFHTATDASKVALVALVEWLRDTGATLLDVQWCTEHLASLGAVEIARDEYLRASGRRRATVPENWKHHRGRRHSAPTDPMVSPEGFRRPV